MTRHQDFWSTKTSIGHKNMRKKRSLKKRRKERALEAAAHNGLTPEEKLNEIGPDHEQAVEDFKAARSQKVRSYLAKKIRDTKKEEKAAASIFLCAVARKFLFQQSKPLQALCWTSTWTSWVQNIFPSACGRVCCSRCHRSCCRNFVARIPFRRFAPQPSSV